MDGSILLGDSLRWNKLQMYTVRGEQLAANRRRSVPRVWYQDPRIPGWNQKVRTCLAVNVVQEGEKEQAPAELMASDESSRYS